MLERGIGVSGERLERGGVVGGLPGIGLAGKHLAEQLSRLLLAPDVRFRERDLEILPRLRLERFARLCTDREHERLRLDGDCLSHCVRLYVHELCRAGVERFSAVSGRRRRHNAGKSALGRRSGIESAADPSLSNTPDATTALRVTV